MFAVAEPIQTQEAETVAREFVSNIILKFGTPEVVLTDQGSNLLSELFETTCKLLRIKKIHTTEIYPDSNGELERGHRILVEYLRHYNAEDQRDWDDRIPYATYVYNLTTQRATGYTPFELLFGYRAQVPSSLQEQPTPKYNYDYVSELKERMQAARHSARQASGKQKPKQAR